MKFTSVVLITNDVPVLTGFYQQVLGMSGEGNETHMAFQLDGSQLAIFSTQGMEGIAPGSMQGAGSGNFTLGFQVADVDTEYKRVKALDVEFILLPTSHSWGSRSIWFRDPDGNIVDFYQVLSP